MQTLALILVTILFTVGVTLLFLNLSAGEKNIKYEIRTSYSVKDPQFLHVMGQLLGPPLVDGNRITGLLNGDEIFPALSNRHSQGPKDDLLRNLHLLGWLRRQGDFGCSLRTLNNRG